MNDKNLHAEIRKLRDELHHRDTELANMLRERYLGEVSVMIVSLLTGLALGYWIAI